MASRGRTLCAATALTGAMLWLSLPSCTLTTDTEGLWGGPPRANDTGAEAETCDPTLCTTSEAIVLKIADLAPCANPQPTDRIGCRRKVHDACIARDRCCYQGGFGPVEFPNKDDATVICVPGKSYSAPWSEVSGQYPGCTTIAGALSRPCEAAAHASATKRGLESALFQLDDGGGNATFLGILPTAADIQIDIPWTELTKLVAGCTLSAVDTQACATAAFRYCTTSPNTDLSGFGPVKWDATKVTLACLF